ncbi:HA1F protein, partial [Ptilonorhynchus violaceus]|nr:HA1F protein [Ptilonorhynchus violaceus]
RYNQSGGLHTAQWVWGCDLLSDGSIQGSHQYGYDGRDFISFELGSRSFVVADGIAEIIKRHWETEGTYPQILTDYLNHTCMEQLRKFIGYGREALKHR